MKNKKQMIVIFALIAVAVLAGMLITGAKKPAENVKPNISNQGATEGVNEESESASEQATDLIIEDVFIEN